MERDFVSEVLSDLAAKFAVKNKEYSTTRDRWANFSDGAALQRESSEQTLIGYVSKQIVSLCAAKAEAPEKLQDSAFVEEKAGDVAVYMVILMAMAREREAAKPKTSEDFPPLSAEEVAATAADALSQAHGPLNVCEFCSRRCKRTGPLAFCGDYVRGEEKAEASEESTEVLAGSLVRRDPATGKLVASPLCG